MNSEKHKLFLKLLMEHQSKIHAYILSLVPNYADADDILQNTSEIIWRRFDQFKPGTNFLAWALRCAYFEILNFRKKKSKSRSLVFDNETLEQIGSILNNEIRSIDHRHEALERCLSELGDTGRNIIEMRYNMDLRPKEIGLRLGYTLAGIYKALSRLHSKLLSCVERKLHLEGL